MIEMVTVGLLIAVAVTSHLYYHNANYFLKNGQSVFGLSMRHYKIRAQRSEHPEDLFKSGVDVLSCAIATLL